MGKWVMAQGVTVADLRNSLTAERVDVKSLARLPMMLAQGLAMVHGVGIDDEGIAANSTVMRLAQLVQAGVLTRDEADTLADAFSTLGEIRIQAHLKAGEARDKVYLNPQQNTAHYAPPELRQVIQNLLPFVDRIENYIANPSQPF